MKSYLLGAAALALAAAMIGRPIPISAEEPSPAYAEPLDSETISHLKNLYSQLIEAENKHDLAAVRPMLWTSPSTLFVAKTATSAMTIAALLFPALGRFPASMSDAADDDEWDKKLTSTLLAGSQVIYIENLSRMLRSGGRKARRRRGRSRRERAARPNRAPPTSAYAPRG